MQDPKAVFRFLGLGQGDVFLDLGCGPGDYALLAAEIVGPHGRVLAVDSDRSFITGLTEEVELRGLDQLMTAGLDFLQESLPVEPGSVDVCLVATVLHMFRFNQVGSGLFDEIRRALRLGGRLGILNCKKEDQPHGPPLDARQSPQDIEAVSSQCGFRKASYHDLGWNYLLVLEAV